MLKDFINIIPEIYWIWFEMIRLVSSANRTILLFVFVKEGR